MESFRKQSARIRWRLRNSVIFLAGLIALFAGTRKKVVRHPRAILILQGAKMGDMVCTTPLFHAIKHAYPKTRVIVVGDKVNKQLLMGHPDVDTYITLQKGFLATARALRNERADFVLLPLPSLEGLALLLWSGARAVAAPRIVGGFSPYETRGYKLLSVFVHAVPHHALHYVPREYLRLLEPIGIRTHDTTKRLIYTPQAHKKIELFFKEHKIVPHRDTIVGILPAVGGDPIKRWLPERFAAVGDHLAKKWGARILILGTGRDEADVTAMVRWSARETRAVNTLNMFSLDEYKALIASLSLFISADTGPVYIAEAFEIPSIDIVGPMYEDIQPPRGELHRTVAAARAKPALGILDNTVYDYREARRQAEAITVDMVNGVANELLEKIQSKKEREVREKSGDTIVDHHPPPAW